MPYITCNKIKLHYERTGQGPGLILLHGLGGDISMWASLVPRLEDSFTIFAFDMRGSGRSDKPQEQYSIDTLTDDAASFVEEVCRTPVNVLGFSMGGMVGMNLASERPELVKRLVLVSTLPSLKGPFPPPARTMELFRRTDISPKLLTEVYEIIFGSAFKKRVSAREYVEFRLNEENPQPIDAYLAQLRALETSDVREKVSTISAPTLIIAGGEDQVVPHRNSLWLNENIRGSEIKIFDKAGHMLPIEVPHFLASEIKENKIFAEE